MIPLELQMGRERFYYTQLLPPKLRELALDPTLHPSRFAAFFMDPWHHDEIWGWTPVEALNDFNPGKTIKFIPISRESLERDLLEFGSICRMYDQKGREHTLITVADGLYWACVDKELPCLLTEQQLEVLYKRQIWQFDWYRRSLAIEGYS